MHRFLPRSLLGQMLLAVALALLAAQTLSAVLIYRADHQRREAALISSLAFQLVSDPRFEFREGNNGRDGRRGRRKIRIERTLETPLRKGELHDMEREAALRDVLVAQDIAIERLVVLSRDVADDDYVMRGRAGPVSGRDGRWSLDGDMLIAGLKRTGENEWLIARVPRPEHNMRALGGLIVQTLLLYIVLVGGLAFLLRRITRPLAALTERMSRFAGRAEGLEPLEPSGPEDTRALIAAHNEMEARIAALLDEKDVMLGAIGHDLKTPLAALRVRIESVDDEAERAKMAGTIEDITHSLDDILSLARVGHAKDPLEKTDLAALVSSVVEEYEDLAEPVELGETMRIALPLRATWLRRALRNLIDNALRYGGAAEVSLAREDGYAAIRVADNGPGIPEGEIAAMFEPFARGEASRNRTTGGAGLGLTLARAIAEQHGGSLSLANRVENGEVVGLVAELRLPHGS
ncbi:ATP-binding protein [Aurantiacibacter suaedae]|uniref:ATP-binding protein n=1 Tax=Aurantiacibacter suaedae TaxID=2545755 RepID=UPI0010F77DE2|nr:ATP-binding protein [Aurantiacibacter suaedae]